MIEAIVAGNLTKDAELRQAGNTQVCGFSVAADTGFGDKKQTLFFSCSLWGNQGAALAQYLKKGNPVTVIGEMSEREYDGKQYKEIRVNSIKLQGGGQSQGQQSQQNNRGYNNQQSQGGQSYNQAPQQFNNQMSNQGQAPQGYAQPKFNDKGEELDEFGNVKDPIPF